MKLRSKILITVAAILLISLAIPAAFCLQFSYVTTWKYCAEFDDFAEEFQTVADYILSSVTDYDGFYCISRTDSGEKRLYDPKTKHYLDCPPEITAALQKICSKNAFPSKDSGLDEIHYVGYRVFFRKEGGIYTLVYSPKEKPTLVAPADGRSLHVRAIGNGWYHVVVR